jgi:SAM-dependent methyltransferase
VHDNAYRSMAREEGRNWYYRARRRAIRTLIERHLGPQAERTILDVGCGTGGTTALLAEFGNVTGVEPSELAIQLCRETYPQLRVLRGRVQDLAALVPAGSFDLATILGVLCHKDVPDPREGLEAVGRCVRPGGWIVWGDCVYPCLARQHDEFVQAERRFYPRQMHRLLAGAGFRVAASTPMLGWAFPLALGLAAAHRLKRRFHRVGRPFQAVSDKRRPGKAVLRPGGAGGALECTDDRPLPGPLNAVLEGLTYWEWRLSLWGIKMPLGVSRLLLAQKLPGLAETHPREAA